MPTADFFKKVRLRISSPLSKNAWTVSLYFPNRGWEPSLRSRNHRERRITVDTPSGGCALVPVGINQRLAARTIQLRNLGRRQFPACCVQVLLELLFIAGAENDARHG